MRNRQGLPFAFRALPVHRDKTHVARPKTERPREASGERPALLVCCHTPQGMVTGVIPRESLDNTKRDRRQKPRKFRVRFTGEVRPSKQNPPFPALLRAPALAPCP